MRKDVLYEQLFDKYSTLRIDVRKYMLFNMASKSDRTLRGAQFHGCLQHFAMRTSNASNKNLKFLAKWRYVWQEPGIRNALYNDTDYERVNLQSAFKGSIWESGPSNWEKGMSMSKYHSCRKQALAKPRARAIHGYMHACIRTHLRTPMRSCVHTLITVVRSYIYIYIYIERE